MRLNVLIFSYHDKEVKVDSREKHLLLHQMNIALLLFWKFVNTIKTYKCNTVI